MISPAGVAIRLVVACLLGGAIGFQRESANRPAGFRTHVLVCVGATLIMLVSMYGFSEVGQVQDPARLAAQVVSGIGFLGAGTIMKEGLNIQGLTTAASLWVVAAIGLAVGSGFLWGALFTTIMVYLALSVMGKVESVLIPGKYPQITLVARDEPGLLGRIGSFLGSKNASIQNVCLSHTDKDPGCVHINLELRLPKGTKVVQLVMELASLSGVLRVEEG